MKAIVIAAIITGFSIGSVFAHEPEGRQDADVLHAGISTECWTEEGRGGAYEVCGTTIATVEVEAEGRGG